jgi:hypothetical protein
MWHYWSCEEVGPAAERDLDGEHMVQFNSVHNIVLSINIIWIYILNI